ncbi:type II toxin-antitoxin system VapB family antitoxin [Ectothiorhodospiraceae bacterium BW-2]|nr:type II toxin-antitoxin system VapB family antitoxin [Ectothiorhodospiraceae bacterium BW-2]
MRTNINLDDQLVNEAFALTKIKTKKELVYQALKEFVENRKRLNLQELKGSGGIADDYDYKALRAGIEVSLG